MRCQVCGAKGKRYGKHVTVTYGRIAEVEEGLCFECCMWAIPFSVHFYKLDKEEWINHVPTC